MNVVVVTSDWDMILFNVLTNIMLVLSLAKKKEERILQTLAFFIFFEFSCEVKHALREKAKFQVSPSWLL